MGGGARGTSYKKAKKYGQSLPTQLRVVLFLFCCCCIFFFLSMKYAITTPCICACIGMRYYEICLFILHVEHCSGSIYAFSPHAIEFCKEWVVLHFFTF